MTKRAPYLAAGLLVLALASCQREERRFSESGRLAARAGDRAFPTPSARPTSDFLDNAWSVSEGQRLFSWFNCGGCHSLGGGGGMGPPLRDATWRYGGTPEDVHRSIVEGRPNGMPAWGTRIPDYQIWQLVAYVLSLSGRLPKDAQPGRGENLALGEPPSMTSEKAPVPEQGAAR